MAVFTMPSEQYQTDLSQIPFRECLRVLSYVQTNIPKVSYFIIKIGILIYSKRIIIIQRRQPQRVLSINA